MSTAPSWFTAPWRALESLVQSLELALVIAYQKTLSLDHSFWGRKISKRVCRFYVDKALVIDYKDPQLLKYFISERGKVVPRRISGNCAFHQRKVMLGIKRARNIALLPFTVTA